jgi:tetratricopeptide (TPR) repeat protein
MAGGRRDVRVTPWIILSEMRRLALALVCVLLVSAAGSAQGLVTGVVRDTNQRPIKGATITAESLNFRSVTVTSDAKGRYAFLGLRGGAWTFTVKAPGFQQARRESTTHTMSANAPVDFELDALAELPPPGPLANLDTRKLQQQLTAAADLENAGKRDEAIAGYRDILAHVPALTSIHLQLGVLFERKGDTAAAVAEYQALLKADPANAKTRAALDRLARQ